MNNSILWTPNQNRILNSYIYKFILHLNDKLNLGLRAKEYKDLYSFSIEHNEKFWSEFWDFAGMSSRRSTAGSCTQLSFRGVITESTVQNIDLFQNVKWFPETKLNYAENILINCESLENQTAIIYNGEYKTHKEMCYAQLYQDVSKMVQFFKSIHLSVGDRVALLANNAPETVVCVLAAAAVGAVCSLCATDFGASGIVDRIAQITPVLFIYFEQATYNGKTYSQLDKVTEIQKRVSSIRNVMSIPKDYQEIMQKFSPQKIHFEYVDFAHPLYIVYSSGTTGVPKCIVHGHGGTLLQHKKEHLLHFDIKPQERVFYYTTCGWMMWQWLISMLASRATLILYDGSPTYPNDLALLKYLDEKQVSFFGTSAKYIDHLRKSNIDIKSQFSFSHLKTIGSTGSPLLPENFDYVYTHWKEDVCLASLSGGTDILSCFVLGNPLQPVHRGEIQCAGLGMAVEVWDESGKPIKNCTGELVCTKPFPSMPVYFWNDPDGSKYHNSYFARYENIWCHGDWALQTDYKGFIIYGRSDTTLNPGGVRIGTAEIYRQVEQFHTILESIVTEHEQDGDTQIVLFVKMRDKLKLDEQMITQIKEKIRQNCSARHVPAFILQVPDVPKTHSGKVVELAVKNIINHRKVMNIASLSNPESLDHFKTTLESALKCH